MDGDSTPPAPPPTVLTFNKSLSAQSSRAFHKVSMIVSVFD